MKLPNKFKGPRSSVSAEAFGSWNPNEAFVPREVEKSGETALKIESRLTQSFMFAGLNSDELNILVTAMEERKV